MLLKIKNKTQRPHPTDKMKIWAWVSRILLFKKLHNLFSSLTFKNTQLRLLFILIYLNCLYFHTREAKVLFLFLFLFFFQILTPSHLLAFNKWPFMSSLCSQVLSDIRLVTIHLLCCHNTIQHRKWLKQKFIFPQLLRQEIRSEWQHGWFLGRDPFLSCRQPVFTMF